MHKLVSKLSWNLRLLMQVEDRMKFYLTFAHSGVKYFKLIQSFPKLNNMYTSAGSFIMKFISVFLHLHIFEFPERQWCLSQDYNNDILCLWLGTFFYTYVTTSVTTYLISKWPTFRICVIRLLSPSKVQSINIEKRNCFDAKVINFQHFKRVCRYTNRISVSLSLFTYFGMPWNVFNQNWSNLLTRVPIFALLMMSDIPFVTSKWSAFSIFGIIL